MELCTDAIIPLLLEVVGAFLGVFGAIWLSRKDTRGKSKELVRSLREELKVIQSELDERLQDKGGSDFYRYPTQIWEINTRSGSLNGMALSDYKIYIDVYSQIEFAQEIERVWFCSSLIEMSTKKKNNPDSYSEMSTKKKNNPDSYSEMSTKKKNDPDSYSEMLNLMRWELAEKIYQTILTVLNSDVEKK